MLMSVVQIHLSPPDTKSPQFHDCGFFSWVVWLKLNVHVNFLAESIPKGAALMICGYGQLSVMATKESVNRAFERGLSDGVMFERRIFHALFGTAEQKEGMDAFLNKRPPQFTHRCNPVRLGLHCAGLDAGQSPASSSKT